MRAGSSHPGSSYMLALAELPLLGCTWFSSDSLVTNTFVYQVCQYFRWADACSESYVKSQKYFEQVLILKLLLAVTASVLINIETKYKQKQIKSKTKPFNRDLPVLTKQFNNNRGSMTISSWSWEGCTFFQTRIKNFGAF